MAGVLIKYTNYLGQIQPRSWPYYAKLLEVTAAADIQQSKCGEALKTFVGLRKLLRPRDTQQQM